MASRLEPNPRTPQPKVDIQKALRALLKRNTSTRSVTIRGERRAHHWPHSDAAMLDDISQSKACKSVIAATVWMRRTSVERICRGVYVTD
jgi:hypothetical protein